jgi:hypothetical protein
VYPLLAVVIALASLGAAVRRAGQFARIELPDTATLFERVQAAAPAEMRREERLSELDDLVREADQLTANPRETSSALARIPLAAGTALALFALAERPEFAALPSAGMAFGVGVGGSMAVAYFGRLASARAARARAHWAEIARRVRARIESGA